MSKTPDRFPGVREDEGMILDDAGVDPTVVGEFRLNSGDLKAMDQSGVFNLRQGSASDIKDIKVTASDSAPGFLQSKLVAGPGVTITLVNPGGDEHLEIVSSGSSRIGLLIFKTDGGLVYDTNGHLQIKFNE